MAKNEGTFGACDLYCGLGDEDGLDFGPEVVEKKEIHDILQQNQEYQIKIQSFIDALEKVHQNNLVKQHNVLTSFARKKEIKYQNSAKCHRKPITLFSAPYFRDIKGFVPEKNEDTIEKEKNKQVDAYLGPLRPWTKREYIRLKNGVYDNIRQRLITPLKNKIATTEHKLMREIYSDEQQQRMLDLIEDYKEEIEHIKTSPADNLAETHKNEIDWLTISSTYLSGSRKAEDCQAMWENYLSPSVNRQPFTKEEDRLLKEIVNEHEERNWELTASRLGTGRTAIQCLERYQHALNSRISNIYWTKEEDENLKNIVNELSMGDYIPWHKVMYHVYGRSRMQVTNRWNRNLAPWLLAGPYCVDEDGLVIAAVEKYKKNWKKISEFIPWRSTCSIRERYSNFLDTDIVTGNWDLKEDLELLKQISIHGEGKWSKICKAVNNRTDSMCNTRALILKKHDPKLYKLLTDRDNPLTPKDPRYPKSQFAPSKVRDNHNESRKCLRREAVDKYVSIYKELTGIEDTDDLPRTKDLIIPSVKFLKSFRNHVYENCSHRQHLVPVKPDYDYGEVRRKSAAKREYSDSNDDEDDDFYLASDRAEASETDSDSEFISEVEEEDVRESKEAKEEVVRKLDLLYAPAIAAGFRKPYVFEKHVVYTAGKDFVQNDILKKIIFKDFKVCINRGVEDNEPCRVRKATGVDLRSSIPHMLRLFVMPKSDEKFYPIVSPNEATLTSTLLCLVNKRKVKEDVDTLANRGYMANVKTITADNKIHRKCIECLKSQTEESVLEELKGCGCEKINRLRNRLLFLRKRFVSVYLLPFVLTHVPLSQIQTNIFFRNFTDGKKEYFTTPKTPVKRRKRKRMKIKQEKLDEEEEEEDDDDEYNQVTPVNEPQFINTRTRCVRWNSSWWKNGILSDDEDEEKR